MFQKNLGWFMILGGNHVRLGSSTWCTPQTRQKLAVYTKFHFDFGHNKATGFSVPLFPAQLNLQRASHKAKVLSHKTPCLRSARPGLYFNVSYEHTMVFFPIIVLWNLLADLNHGKAETELFFSFFMALIVLHLFQVVSNYLLICLVMLCINRACATVHPSKQDGSNYTCQS